MDILLDGVVRKLPDFDLPHFVSPLLPWTQEVEQDDRLHLDFDDETWGLTS
jgi:hypothetical protein